jgi:hypothetical protein
VFGVGETGDGTLGVLVTPLTDQPPGGLRHEAGHYQERDGPDPLECEGKLPTDYCREGQLECITVTYPVASTHPMSDRSVMVALATPELIKIPTPQQKLTSGEYRKV